MDARMDRYENAVFETAQALRVMASCLESAAGNYAKVSRIADDLIDLQIDMEDILSYLSQTEKV